MMVVSTLNKEYAAFYWRLVAAFNDDDDDGMTSGKSIQALKQIGQ